MIKKTMIGILLGSILLNASMLSLAKTNKSGEKACVIVLHGLARSAKAMKKLAKSLSAEGYAVVNVDYPSRKHSVTELADIAIEDGLQTCQTKTTNNSVHFVTHSLGGILVRERHSRIPIPGLARVVMLGPPNKGSETVDKLANTPGFELINGPAGYELGTGDNGIVHTLPPVDFELGVIAGTRSINLILSQIIPGKDDGKVSVESAKVEGMNDFIVLPTTHTFMMRNDEVIRQVIHFLDRGRFDSTKA